MNETRVQKKKRKKQFTFAEEAQLEDAAVKNAVEVTQALDELAKEGKHLDIQVCPRCKSPRVKRAQSTGGDMWAHIGLTPPSYECPDCGWQERIVLKATNKPLTVREVELIREAMEIDDKEVSGC